LRACRKSGCLPVSSESLNGEVQVRVNEPRTILVTGVSAGIGRAICHTLVARGQRVVGIARQPNLAGIEHELFVPLSMDLQDLDSLPAALSGLAKTYPEISAVVCNAGRGQFGSLEEFSYQNIRALVDLNLTAQMYLARAFIPTLKRHSHSDLILMGSETALWGGRRGAVYSATKAALRGFAQALRDECSRSGMRVCIVNPGMVRTGFFDQQTFEPGADAANALEPEDVARVVLQVLESRPGVVFDEINLSPLKKVLKFK